jgi:hypothetical protein
MDRLRVSIPVHFLLRAPFCELTAAEKRFSFALMRLWRRLYSKTEVCKEDIPKNAYKGKHCFR